MTHAHRATFEHNDNSITLEMSLEAMEKLTQITGVDGYVFMAMASNSPLKLVKMFDAFQFGSKYTQNDIFKMFFINSAEVQSEEFINKLANVLATVTGNALQEKIDAKETPIKKKRVKANS